jgi:crossover junction endodeoxyribonuclease RusA
MIELRLPYPPTVNHYKRPGRLTKTKTGKIYQPQVNTDATTRFYYQVWMLIRGNNIKSLGGAVLSLELDVYPPDARKRDIDNVIKPLLDSLQKANLFDDDYQIARLLVTRKAIIRQGQIVLRIQEL